MVDTANKNVAEKKMGQKKKFNVFQLFFKQFKMTENRRAIHARCKKKYRTLPNPFFLYVVGRRVLEVASGVGIVHRWLLFMRFVLQGAGK